MASSTDVVSVKFQGFTSSSRLLNAADYRYVFQKAQKAGDDCFLILGRHAEREMPRLGLAVAKKQAKRAVDRNRLKRVIRESFRRQQNEIFPADYVILVRKSAKELPNQVLSQSLERLWRKIGQRLDAMHEL